VLVLAVSKCQNSVIQDALRKTSKLTRSPVEDVTKATSDMIVLVDMPVEQSTEATRVDPGVSWEKPPMSPVNVTPTPTMDIISVVLMQRWTKTLLQLPLPQCILSLLQPLASLPQIPLVQMYHRIPLVTSAHALALPELICRATLQRATLLKRVAPWTARKNMRSRIEIPCAKLLQRIATMNVSPGVTTQPAATPTGPTTAAMAVVTGRAQQTVRQILRQAIGFHTR
jgi:hypothetical protein